MERESAKHVISEEFPDLLSQDSSQYEMLVSLLTKYGFAKASQEHLDKLGEIVRQSKIKAAKRYLGNYEQCYIWAGDIEKFTKEFEELITIELRKLSV